MAKRLKVINGYAAHARYLSTVGDEPVSWIARTAIPSPYAYSPTHAIFQTDSGQHIFIVETQHRRYEVFTVTDETVFDTDEAAADAYIATIKAA